MPVSVKLLKKNGGKTPETAVLLPDVVFTYIDKGANWKNQCPKTEEEPEPEVEDALQLNLILMLLKEKQSLKKELIYISYMLHYLKWKKNLILCMRK